jgi:hypothetical protein
MTKRKSTPDYKVEPRKRTTPDPSFFPAARTEYEIEYVGQYDIGVGDQPNWRSLVPESTERLARTGLHTYAHTRGILPSETRVVKRTITTTEEIL